jgi:AmmeMemoRadiSam system protein B
MANRRRDELALDQLRAGNPEGHFQACIQNDINMCGMSPAVAILSALNSEREGDVEITKYDTSAKVSGDSSRVVGYAGALLK